MAGLKTLEVLKREGAYDTIIGHGERLMAAAKIALIIMVLPTALLVILFLFDIVFIDQDVLDYRGTKMNDTQKANAYNASLRASGILKPAAKICHTSCADRSRFTANRTSIKGCGRNCCETQLTYS